MKEIIEYLERQGYTGIPTDFYEHIEDWRAWYQGKTGWHSYNYYNGQKKVGRERATLGMSKTLAEDRADLLLNEKVTITVPDPYQEALNAILKANDFWVRGNQLIELTAALGTGAFVEYLGDDDEPKIDYIRADMIIPLASENKLITECAFSGEIVRKDGVFVYLNIHTVSEGGRYVIENRFFEKLKGGELREVEPFDGIESVIQGGYNPLFQIVTLNIVNNVDLDCPMGISIYANAIDQLRGVDLVYDSYDNEFLLGRKRVFVKDNVVKISLEDGTPMQVFDANDAVFYGLPFQDNEKSIQEIDMTLRASEHETALNNRLNLLSMKCGFGQDFYKFDATAGGVKTATEVISENSDLYRSIRKDEILLESALTAMVVSVMSLSGISINPAEVSINFDDSVIEDAGAVKRDAMLEYQAQLIDDVAYFMTTRKLTEDQALELVNAMRKRSPPLEETDYFTGSDGGEV